MPPPPVILRHPTRPTGRVASVSADPTGAGTHLLRLARGDHPDRLAADRTLGPFDDNELQAAFDAAVTELRTEGYQTGGLVAAIDLLTRAPRDPRRRATAAGRLFWHADQSACGPLLAALAEANEEACPLIDALGRCGDERAYEAVRENAARKLLSRRRSGVEALIHLNDADGIAAARDRVRAELPDDLSLDAVDDQRRGQSADFLYEYAGLDDNPAAADAAVRWAESLPFLGEPFAWRYVKSLFKRSCLRLDADAFGRLARLIDAAKTRPRTANLKSGLTGQTTLTPVFRAATRDYLRRRAWRHLRRLAEHEPARYAEHAASLIAAYRPADTAAFARKSDAYRFNKTFGIDPWSRSYLVGHVLHGGDATLKWHGTRWSDAGERNRRTRVAQERRRRAPSAAPPAAPDSPLTTAQRYELMTAGAVFSMERPSIWQRTLAFLRGDSQPGLSMRMIRPADPRRLHEQQNPPQIEPEREPARTESYPHLWDAAPRAYLTVLAKARVPEFARFALDAVRQRHPDLPRQATADELLGMLDAPLEDAAELAAVELRRRLDADDPPWDLVRRLADDGRGEAREVAYEVLRRRADVWAGDVDRVAALMTGPRAETADVAAGVLVERLPAEADQVRRAVAGRLLEILRDPPPPVPVPIEEGADAAEAAAMFAAADDPRLDAVARVLAEALAAEADEQAGPTAALPALLNGPAPAATVAAAVLARRDDAADALGLDGLLALADHDLAAVRAAAMRIVAETPRLWENDPTPLLAVAEGRWPDARLAALSLLFDRVDFDRLGVDALQSLLDSTMIDVRTAAMRAAADNLDRLDAAELAGRLAEHPACDVRLFAFDLAATHLPADAASLIRLRPLLVSSLLDATPSRAAKRRAFDALARLGTADAEAARVAADVLLPVRRSAVAADAERATSALVTVKLAHPDAFAGVRIAAIGGAA